MKYLLLFSLLFPTACSFKKGQLENQSQSGHEELYSKPDAPKEKELKNLRRIVIAATNDLQGNYRPQDLSFKDNHHSGKQSIKIGGVNYISSYFKILREHYGEILLVDAGDIFPSQTDELKYARKFYSHLGYDAVTVGMSDFNIKLPAEFKTNTDLFKQYAAKSKAPLILSNLYELKTARPVDWPGTLPYLLKSINGVKVGVIGLIPDDIVDQTPVDDRVGLYVESMLQSTLHQSRLLRSLGAEIIVLITHQGLNCGTDLAEDLNLPLSKVNFEPEKKDVCDLSGRFGQFLNRLPPDLVNVVITGRHHQKTVNYINNTLIISNFGDAKSFIYTEFFVDQETKKVVPKMTIAHQPVMFCQEFFKETIDCYTEDKTVDHKVRIPAKFLGKTIESDKEAEKKFRKLLENKVKVSVVNSKIQPLIDLYQAQIVFQNDSKGNSKLVLLSINGTELIKILENDYNQGLDEKWQPSPFILKNAELSLFIQGNLINKSVTYKVLADMEDIQTHPTLRKIISRAGHKPLNNVSWNEPDLNNDKVSTTMAASDAVR